MDIKIENNELRINIQDLFDQLDDDQLQELEEHFMWHSSIYKNLQETMKNNLAGEGYNETLFKLEKAFFLIPTEDPKSYDWNFDHEKDKILYTMNQAIREILKENARLRSEIYKHGCARLAVYTWLKNNYDEDIAYKANNIYLASQYDEPTAYELSKLTEKEINLKSMVEEWVDNMIAKFNPISELRDS
jgi:hypothetical protein